LTEAKEAKVFRNQVRSERSFVRCLLLDTDTLYIEFKEAHVAETRDLDEDTLLDVDRNGNICGITVEHASHRADIPRFSYEQVAA